ncbi:MAG: alpha/beta hydrolase [Minisyncoccia bacterium]
MILIILATTIFCYLKNKVEKGSESNFIKQKKVIFQTDDGVNIVGDFYYNPNSKFAGILVHSLGSNKERFKNLSEYLLKSNYSILAIDLRGHNESINSINGRLNWKDIDCKNYIYDLFSASKFLETKGFKISNQFLIGEEEGANISLKFLSLNEDIKALVLLSPKENYCGISLEKYIKKEMENKIMIITDRNFDLFQKSFASSTILTYQKKFKDKIFDIKEINDKIKVFLIEHLI